MCRQKPLHIRFDSVYCFSYPLEVLECISVEKRGSLRRNVIVVTAVAYDHMPFATKNSWQFAGFYWID